MQRTLQPWLSISQPAPHAHFSKRIVTLFDENDVAKQCFAAHVEAVDPSRRRIHFELNRTSFDWATSPRSASSLPRRRARICVKRVRAGGRRSGASTPIFKRSRSTACACSFIHWMGCKFPTRC